MWYYDNFGQMSEFFFFKKSGLVLKFESKISTICLNKIFDIIWMHSPISIDRTRLTLRNNIGWFYILAGYLPLWYNTINFSVITSDYSLGFCEGAPIQYVKTWIRFRVFILKFSLTWTQNICRLKLNKLGNLKVYSYSQTLGICWCTWKQ